MNLIKLIWDFRGPVSKKTARHFHSHLKEFLALEKMSEYKTFTSENLEQGYRFLEKIKPPYVLKADGLAAGKGVLILNSLKERKSNLIDLN